MSKEDIMNRISFALKDPVLQMGFEVICSKLARLEKENAELKEQCSILADCNTCNSTCKNENVEMKKQLTKAKEILTKLLEEEKNNMYWEMNGSDKSSYYEVRKQAEQFLKE